MDAPLIAVFDVGKTHAKIALVDPALGQEIWSARRANAVVQGVATRELDIVAIESWLLESLGGAPQREREAFTVVSSGTWTIVMANRGDLRRLREERDMLANVNVFGAPIATARYMGGREYEAIAQGAGAPTTDALIEVLARGCLALPSFASAGPYAGRPGRQEGAEGLGGAQRAALATLYSALMTAQLIESLGTAGEIFIDGPLARNPLFAGLLGACVPVGTVRIYPEGGGTRVAAHLAGLPSPRPGELYSVTPLRVPGLLEYQAGWRHRLEERT
jgi:sugar (pentulose or hexulose) kinase